MHRYRNEILIGALVVGATLLVYWPALSNDFVYYDDHIYVTENPHVQAGLSGSSVWWAFTTLHGANWHPLTWLSLQLDAQRFRSKPWGFHFTNIVLHVTNSLLLFAWLRLMTRAVVPSGFVAGLFALHPLHVESVAWVAERKDVLSTFFWMLTLLAYVRYTRQPKAARLALVAVLLALGLMAKPMLVTLPFVLLLLDYWPLGRYGGNESLGDVRKVPRRQRRRSWLPSQQLLVEKTPLFILVGLSCIITLIAQARGGAVATLERLPVQERVANALVAWATYIFKTFWPQDLSVFYPRDHSGALYWQALLAGLFLAAATIAACRQWKQRPSISVGWLWYLGTLVPAIGLVQVGDQAYADRYTYIPLIGLFIMVAWGARDVAAGWRYQTTALTALGTAALLTCGIYSWVQVQYWQNDITLWEHALDVNPRNAVAHNNLAIDLARLNQLDDSLHHFDAALRIDPNYEGALENRKKAQARIYLREGAALAAKGQVDEAIKCYESAVRLDPPDAVAHYELGTLLAEQGKWEEAMAAYAQGVKIDPSLVPARCGLAYTLQKLEQTERAQKEYQQATELDPQWPARAAQAAWTLATHSYAHRRNGRQATQLAEEACQATGFTNPLFLDALAAAQAESGRFDEAIATGEKARGLAVSANNAELAKEMAERIGRYKSRRAWHD
jgi:tetratricopeptide (TPR) repeat protein